MTDERRLKCFLSYDWASRADGDNIAMIFRELGVDAFAASDTDPGQAIEPTILGALRAADFVCVVLSAAPPSANVAFEAGLAVGMDKPMLVLARDAFMPFDVGRGVQFVRLTPGDLASSLSDVRRFLRHVRPKKQIASASPGINPGALVRVRDELARARHAANAAERGHALVDVVALLFSRPDFELLREEVATGSNRPDLIIWSDPLVAELGGPMILECKYYGGGSGSVLANARHSLQQLAKYVDESSAALGLLVFDHDRPNDLKLSTLETPNVLAFYVEDLINACANDKLADELWRKRARAGLLTSPRADAG